MTRESISVESSPTLEALAVCEQVLPLARSLSVLGPNNEDREALYGLVERTRLKEVPGLITGDNTLTFVKDEGEQLTRSYKERGAFVSIREAKKRDPNLIRVAANSAGNHGQGVAYAGNALGIPEVIITTFSGANPDKVRAMRALGADVREYPDLEVAGSVAEKIGKMPNSTFISPFDAIDTITGQSTLMSELAADMLELNAAGKIDFEADELYVVAPGGGGGCAAGMAIMLDDLKQQGVLPKSVQFYVAQVDGSTAIFEAVNGHVPQKPDPMCDGTNVTIPGKLPLAIISDKWFVQGVHVVPESYLGESIISQERKLNHPVEAAGALSLAGARYLQATLPPPLPGSKRAFFTIMSGGNSSLKSVNHFKRAAYDARAQQASANRAAFAELSEEHLVRSEYGLSEVVKRGPYGASEHAARAAGSVATGKLRLMQGHSV